MHETKKISVEIVGNQDEFYEGLDYIKSLPDAEYNAEDKVWLIPRKEFFIKKLESKFQVAYKKSKPFLLNQKIKYKKTGADDLINDYGTVSNFMKHFNNNKIYDMLFDFQKLGVASALYHISENNGFLIGDDMGAGKTIEALGVVTALKSIDKIDKALVSCPKNVLYQWGKEVDNFTDLNYVVVDGYNKDKRLECYDKDADIYIINHDLLILDDDYKKLENINFDLLIADEVHYFKNRDTLRTQAIKTLSGDINYNLGLTGTPLQNKPEDTFSIFELLIPDYLDTWSKFSKKHICWRYINGNPRPVGYRNLETLNKKVAQKMIRRESEDISDDLPVVKHKDHKVPSSTIQDNLFDEVNEIITDKKEKSILEELDDDELEQLDGTIMGMKNILIEISDDPRLLNMSSSHWIRQMANCPDDFICPKLSKAKQLVGNILKYNEDFKIVIFSKFLKMVEILQEELSKLNIVDDTVLIHGGINNKQRHENVEQFRNNKDCRILISSDAGAEGLDLQNASHLINYDLPWSPAKLDQRNGRIRRIGSTWDEVYVSNIITEGSIDERIKEVIREKREIYDIIISNSNDQKKALEKFVTENIA